MHRIHWMPHWICSTAQHHRQEIVGVPPRPDLGARTQETMERRVAPWNPQTNPPIRSAIAAATPMAMLSPIPCRCQEKHLGNPRCLLHHDTCDMEALELNFQQIFHDFHPNFFLHPA